MEKLTPFKSADNVIDNLIKELHPHNLSIVELVEEPELTARIAKTFSDKSLGERTIEMSELLSETLKEAKKFDIHPNDWHGANFGRDAFGIIRMFDFSLEKMIKNKLNISTFSHIDQLQYNF